MERKRPVISPPASLFSRVAACATPQLATLLLRTSASQACATPTRATPALCTNIQSTAQQSPGRLPLVRITNSVVKDSLLPSACRSGADATLPPCPTRDSFKIVRAYIMLPRSRVRRTLPFPLLNCRPVLIRQIDCAHSRRRCCIHIGGISAATEARLILHCSNSCYFSVGATHLGRGTT